MRLYILVEDGKSFYNIFPQWLKILLPKYERARTINEMNSNSYVLFSGKGYPRLLGTNNTSEEKNVLGSAIDTINECNIIDYLIICLDGDDIGIKQRIRKTTGIINNYENKLKCRYKILIQNKCVETWFLGNHKVFPICPSPVFYPYYDHYNVKTNDPEDMEKPEFYTKSVSLYHEEYLKKMLAEKNIVYLKGKPPQEIQDRTYFYELMNKTKNTNHLKSLKHFIDFFASLNAEDAGRKTGNNQF